MYNIYFRPIGVIVNNNIVCNCKCVKLHTLIITIVSYPYKSLLWFLWLGPAVP